MGQIVRSASSVTNFTITIETQSPISHISHLVLSPRKLTIWIAGCNPPLIFGDCAESIHWQLVARKAYIDMAKKVLQWHDLKLHMYGKNFIKGEKTH